MNIENDADTELDRLTDNIRKKYFHIINNNKFSCFRHNRNYEQDNRKEISGRKQ